MPLTTYNDVAVPSFMYGTAWKKDATARLVHLAVESGFSAIDTANQLIHYQEALVGEALQALALKGFTRDRLFLQTSLPRSTARTIVRPTMLRPISPLKSDSPSPVR